MQTIQKIEEKVAATVPCYGQVAKYTALKYKQGHQCFNNLYLCSTNKAKNISKVSKQYRNDALWMVSQAADDLLELMEDKLEVEPLKTKQTGKAQRLVRMYDLLREEHIMPYLQKLVELDGKFVKRGKVFQQEYLLPLYIRVKATIEVSREMIMEIFAARIGELKMTYKFSKDSVTMFWSGEFKEEKMMESVKEKFGCLKQFTISFVQKGMEIKVSKEDLSDNYHHIMEKLAELMKEAGQKSTVQWVQTKTKTIDLYQTVLRRIKEKESMLMVKSQAVQDQVVSVPKPVVEKPFEEKKKEQEEHEETETPKEKKESSEEHEESGPAEEKIESEQEEHEEHEESGNESNRSGSEE